MSINCEVGEKECTLNTLQGANKGLHLLTQFQLMQMDGLDVLRLIAS